MIELDLGKKYFVAKGDIVFQGVYIGSNERTYATYVDGVEMKEQRTLHLFKRKVANGAENIVSVIESDTMCPHIMFEEQQVVDYYNRRIRKLIKNKEGFCNKWNL